MPGPLRTIPLLALVLATACDRPGPPPRLAEGVTPEGLTSRLERFVAVAIDAPTQDLEPWERVVLARLVRASEVTHELFLRQMAEGLPELRAALATSDSAWAPAAAAYFDRMAGPWDRLAGDAPFLAVGPRPAGGGFYPEGVTAADIDAWLREHPEDREAFTHPLRVVRREHGTLIAVPYSAEYREALGRAAGLLREAAASSHSASLRRYLEVRSAALPGEGRADLDEAGAAIEDTRIEAVFGPYVRGEDRLLGAKAAFAGVVALVDAGATRDLDDVRARIVAADSTTPGRARPEEPEGGAPGRVLVVDLIHAAGAPRAGVHAVALAVPGSGHGRPGPGARTLVLRNVARARFEHVLAPLAAIVLGPAEAETMRFEPWFAVILSRAIARDLAQSPGPGEGASTPSARGLDPHRAVLEEAHAGAAGLRVLEASAGAGRHDEGLVHAAYAAHLADLFRAARLGPSDPRAEAAAMQFGWAWERRGIHFDEELGVFTLDRAAFAEASRELAAEILRIQAGHDVAAAASLRERYGAPRPELADFLPRLASLPVDIRPEYVAAARLLDGAADR